MASAQPFFSIVLPTYNRMGPVCQAVESVRGQTFRDFELLVADDGSSDGTQDFLKRRYSSEIAEGRIRLLELPHGGACAARNAALSAATGTWIAYLDSDNVVSPDFLQTFADGIAANPDARNFYAALVRRSNGTVLDEPFSREVLLKWNFIDIGVYCHHRDLFAEFGGFDQDVVGVEDWDLVIRHSSRYEPVRLGRIVLNYCDLHDGDRISLAGTQQAHTRAVRRRFAAPRPDAVSDEDVETIASSPFFDGQWYAGEYGDLLEGADPARHYLSVGWLCGCNPGPLFVGDGYLRYNKDIAAEGVNPLLHYERFGRAEGRLGFMRRVLPPSGPSRRESKS